MDKVDSNKNSPPKKDSYQFGVLSIIAGFSVFIALLLFIVPAIRLLVCYIFQIRCIDEETGERIVILWEGISLWISFAAALFFIEVIYYKLSENLKSRKTRQKKKFGNYNK